MSTLTENWPNLRGSDWNGDLTWTVSTPTAGHTQQVQVADGSAGHRFAESGGDSTVTGFDLGRAESDLATDTMAVQATVALVDSGSSSQALGVLARFAAGALTCYGFDADVVGGTTIRLRKWVAGTPTTLQSATLAVAVNDVLRLEVTGGSTTTLTGFVNGTQQITIADSSSPITGNTRAGAFANVNRFSAFAGLSTWTATDITGGGTNYSLIVDTMTVGVVLDAVTLTYTPVSGSGAYVFGSATSDIVDCGTTVTHASTWSVAARFTITTADGTLRRLVMFTQPTGSQTSNALLQFQGGTNVVHAGVSRAGGTFVFADWTTGFTAGSTHTLVATCAGSGGVVSIYADTDATAKAVSASLASNPDQDTDQAFCIGNLSTFSDSAHATIYEVGWWPGTVLTGAQAASLGTGGQMAFGFPQPTNYYSFDGNANDLFGGKHGTVTGATQTADAATSWFPAALGGTTLAQVGLGGWRGMYRGLNRGAR